jgi:hypothetical protein
MIRSNPDIKLHKKYNKNIPDDLQFVLHLNNYLNQNLNQLLSNQNYIVFDFDSLYSQRSTFK